MAISSYDKKPLSSLLLLPFIAIFLLLLVNRVNSQEQISYHFNGFTQGDRNLILQGDATISSNRELQLTRVDNNGNPFGGSVGRALLSEPIRLYDRSSGRVSQFLSSFTFRISNPRSSTPADGLTFFIASAHTTIPPNSNGAFLGLFNANLARNNSHNEFVGFKQSSDQVVAVEFDTYSNVNLGDPNYRHVGVDVNSIRSQITAEWQWQNGQPLVVTIYYLPATNTLRVFGLYQDGSKVDFTHQLDLTTVLPEWVRVGFSGSTGLYSQVNNILSWSFSSSLPRPRNMNDDDVDDHISHIASVV